METQVATVQLSADQPIRSIRDDLLGRGEFALALANALSAWRGDESLVLALYGPWGSGKSSVKNLVLEFLDKAEKPTTVMHFNPWAWSGQDALFNAFFTEIGGVIGHRAKGEQRKEAASKWKKYASRLALGGTVLKHLKTATQIAGIPVVPLVLEGLSNAAEKSSELAKKGAESEGADDEEPLESMKESLAESLRQIGRSCWFRQ
jgi:predicted KAP-like P-loop ATPase